MVLASTQHRVGVKACGLKAPGFYVCFQQHPGTLKPHLSDNQQHCGIDRGRFESVWMCVVVRWLSLNCRVNNIQAPSNHSSSATIKIVALMLVCFKACGLNVAGFEVSS